MFDLNSQLWYLCNVDQPSATQLHEEDLTVPFGKTPESPMLRAMYADHNAQKSLTLARANPTTPALHQIRAALFKNDLSETSRLLEGKKTEDRDPEILLESARLSFLSGQWAEAVSIVNRALSIELDPASTTRLTLIQVRATAFYEMGEFDKAEHDLEVVLLSRQLFPEMDPMLFCRVLRAMILANRGSTEQARQHLRQLAIELVRSDGLHQESLLSLLRGLITIKRCEQKSVFHEARACLNLARLIGADLYEGFAALDLLYSNPMAKEDCPLWLAQLIKKHSHFARISLLLGDDEGSSVPSTSARLLASYQSAANNDSQRVFKAKPEMSHILFPDLKLRLDFNPYYMGFEVNLSESVVVFLEQICEQAVTKENAFSLLTQLKQYKKNVHAHYFRSRISKLRKLSGIFIKNDQNVISAPDSSVIRF